MSFNDKLSYTEHSVVSPTSDFTIGFEDYALTTKDRINVTVNDVDAKDAGYTVTRKSNLIVTLTPPVPSGVVRLQRETNIDTPFHRFTAGAKFVAANVDQNFTQVLHSQQEVRNLFGFTQAYIQRTLDNFDLRIQGVEGVVIDLRKDYNNLDTRLKTEVQLRQDGDAALKDYIDSTVNGVVGENFLPIADTFVLLKSGRTQRAKNGETVSPEDAGAVGDNVADDRTAVNAVRALNQYQHLDIINRYRLSSPINFSFQSVIGRNSRNSGFTGKITASTRAHFERLRLRSTEDSEDYALEILAGTNGVDNFYNRINNNFFYGHSGIQINGGVETLIDGNRFFGQQSSMSGEKVGTAIDNRNIDNTICNTYIERSKYGVNTGNSMESTNLHIVVADTALTVRGASRSGYSQFVNNYIDSPKDFGILLEDTDNVNFMNTRMYKVNRYNQDGALGIGVRLGGQSSYNRFINMCFQNLEGNCKQSIDFNGTKHIGNLFVGLSGDHVMSATNQNIMRKQISVGNTKDWSKYNQSNKYRHYFDYVDKDASDNITYKVQIPKGMTITSAQRGSNIIEYNGKLVVRGYGGAGGFFEFKLLSCRDILGIDDNFVKITKVAGVEAIQLSSVTVDHISDASEFIEVTCVVNHVSTNSTKYQATLEIERGIDSKGVLC